MSATTTHLTLRAPDISCGHCEATVAMAVKEISGVIAVQPSSETKLVEIEIDPERVTRDQIEAAMRRAGYPVES